MNYMEEPRVTSNVICGSVGRIGYNSSMMTLFSLCDVTRAHKRMTSQVTIYYYSTPTSPTLLLIFGLRTSDFACFDWGVDVDVDLRLRGRLFCM